MQEVKSYKPYKISNSLSWFFFSYDPRDDKWNVLADMPTARALAGCTIFKNKIYVIGKNGYIADTIVLEMHIEKNKQQ